MKRKIPEPTEFFSRIFKIKRIYIIGIFVILIFFNWFGLYLYGIIWSIMPIISKKYYCKCRTKNSTHAKYCKKCGKSLFPDNYTKWIRIFVGILSVILLIVLLVPNSNSAEEIDYSNNDVTTTQSITNLPTSNISENQTNISKTNETFNITNNSNNFSNITTDEPVLEEFSYEPDNRIEFILRGDRSGWQDTDVFVNKDQRVIIDAKGEIIWDVSTGQSSSPIGDESLAYTTDMLCAQTPMSLVIRVLNNCSFVGNHYMFTSEYNSYFKLGYNDYFFRDNSGYFNVTINPLQETYNEEQDGVTYRYRINNTIEFTGNYDPIQLLYDPMKHQFSISFWAKTDKQDILREQSNTGITGTQQNYIFHPDQAKDMHGSSVYSGLGISYGTNGIQVFEHSDKYLPAVLVYSDNLGTDWHYIVVTQIDGITKLYIDGIYVKRGIQSTKSIIFSPTTVGGGMYGKFQGSVRDIRVYNYELNDNEVKTIWSSGK